MEDMYVIKEGKRLRCGYTTGSCVAGASKAAALMLENNKIIKYVEIDTPAGVKLKLEVVNPNIGKDKVSCAIIKDGGDDPDVTDGMEIYAEVRKRADGQIHIDGGEGIGRIARKGLFGEIGKAAINPVPKEMVIKELNQVSNSGYDVLIYAPSGKEIAKKTYNKNIGIEGGISIIGTKGIVYPMSEDALKKTIYLEIDTIIDKYGTNDIVFVPGNYGEKIADSLGLKDKRVKISNYIGDSLLYAYNKKIKSITLIGHIGKLAKLSIGAFNTHSRVCDGRMEAFIYYLAFMKAPFEVIRKVNNSLTAEEALDICINEGYKNVINAMEKGCEDRIRKYLKDEEYQVKVIIYSMKRGVFL